MNKSFLIIGSILTAFLSLTARAQPAGVVRDGFSDEAEAYLKKNPQIQKCAIKMAKENNAGRKKQGLEERTTYDEFGEFISICAKKLPLKSSSTSNSVLAQDMISGEYSGKNRFAQFEKMKNGDVKFYISGMQIGSQYSCNIGDGSIGVDSQSIGNNPAFLKMNGSTGGYQDANHIISVEFDKNTAKVIIGKSQCIVDGVYKKTGGKNKVSWTGGGD